MYATDTNIYVTLIKKNQDIKRQSHFSRFRRKKRNCSVHTESALTQGSQAKWQNRRLAQWLGCCLGCVLAFVSPLCSRLSANSHPRKWGLMVPGLRSFASMWETLSSGLLASALQRLWGNLGSETSRWQMADLHALQIRWKQQQQQFTLGISYKNVFLWAFCLVAKSLFEMLSHVEEPRFESCLQLLTPASC